MPPRRDAETRFWAKVNKNGPTAPHMETCCWVWTAATLVDGGYGAFRPEPKILVRAHRYAYQTCIGQIPDGKQVDHCCLNPVCVRSEHLRLVTNKQNSEHIGAINSRSGFRGVYQRGNKWIAQVMHNRKTIYVGIFENINDANAAAVAKRNELFTHNDLDRQ
jgi:hypothetical protein